MNAAQPRALPIDEETLRRVLSSGIMKAYQCGPAPKFRDRRRGQNRGKGTAIKWLCEHANFDGKECLFWPFAKDRGHPACLGYLGKMYKASRLMCALAHGAPPTDLHEASYTCGHSHEGCINPRHLAWKTQSENQRDQAINGRPFYGKQGKLTAAQAADIRAIGDTMRRSDVAKLYGISPQRVTGLLQGIGFTRPRKPWSLRNGRFYSRIGYRHRKFSLGGYATAAESIAAYDAALERARRGEFPIAEQTEPRNLEIRRFYAAARLAFGDGAEFGQRVIAVDPVQEQSSFQLFAALEKLDPRVKKFVLSVSECGEIEEAAASVGFDAATVAILLPRLKVFLDPFVH